MSTQTLVARPSTPTPNQTAEQTTAQQTTASTRARLLAAGSHSRYDASARRIELWSPWGERERPSTAAEEAIFIARLRELSAGCTPPASGETTHRRYDITAVVTALRSAVTADEMLRSAPGLRPQAVVAAYDHLEACRSAAVTAWQTLVADPTSATFAAVGDEAALLLPVAVSRLRALLGRHDDPAVFARTVAQIDREIQATHARALQLEDMLTGIAGPAAAAQAAELLNDAWGEGLWSLATFVAPRVGTLVSVRLSSLLGEDRHEVGRRSSAGSGASRSQADIAA